MSQTVKPAKPATANKPATIHYAPVSPAKRFSVPTQTLCHILNGVGVLAIVAAIAGPVAAIVDQSSYLTTFYYMKSFAADLSLAAAVFGLSRLVVLAELLCMKQGS